MDLSNVRVVDGFDDYGTIPGLGLRNPLEDEDNPAYARDDEDAVNEFFSSGMHFSLKPDYTPRRG